MKCLLIGPSGSGKSTLGQALSGGSGPVTKTQMLEFSGEFLDTPGVYLDNPNFYPALIVSSQQADCVILAIAADQRGCPIPEGFVQAFSRPVMGVVSKTDLDEADPDRAQALLKHAGVKEPHYLVSAATGQGLEELKKALHELCE